MNPPLIELKNVSRTFLTGAVKTPVLRELNLSINRGEMVAIMGASGSGKSTLLNILGCLDNGFDGEYFVDGISVKKLSQRSLAGLRNHYFGFVFQRYNLLARWVARDNILLPGIYRRMPWRSRIERARALLTQFSLASKELKKPTTLSGGEQQRIAVSRAMFNGSEIILADEPTGALDEKNGLILMNQLKSIHKKGRTIVLITHDPKVAKEAQRIIHIADGQIVKLTHTPQKYLKASRTPDEPKEPVSLNAYRGASIVDTLFIAARSIFSHPLKFTLTALGIIIGIASVVTILGVSQGARQQVLENFSTSLNNIALLWEPNPDAKVLDTKGFSESDVSHLRHLPYIEYASPVLNSRFDVGYTAKQVRADGFGVTPSYLTGNKLKLAAGSWFSDEDVRRYSPLVLLSTNVAENLLGHSRYSEILGRPVLLNGVSLIVAGVVISPDKVTALEVAKIWLPYSIMESRLGKNTPLDQIYLRVKESYSVLEVETALKKDMAIFRGKQDVQTFTQATALKQYEESSKVLTMVLSLIATMSLLVGGIGVMNVVYMSVRERIREIGICMALGATRGNIQAQFLIESTFVCLIGAFFGVLIAIGLAPILQSLVEFWKVILTAQIIGIAVVCACGIGLIFGYFPARSAARLNIVEALSRE